MSGCGFTEQFRMGGRALAECACTTNINFISSNGNTECPLQYRICHLNTGWPRSCWKGVDSSTKAVPSDASRQNITIEQATKLYVQGKRENRLVAWSCLELISTYSMGVRTILYLTVGVQVIVRLNLTGDHDLPKGKSNNIKAIKGILQELLSEILWLKTEP